MVHIPAILSLALLGLGAGVIDPSADPRDCTVHFTGEHGGQSGEIEVDFRESQVRTRNGAWVSVVQRRFWGSNPGRTHTAIVRPGEPLRRQYELRLGCDANRRYRFVISHERETHTYVFPSEDDYTQDREIDLGALSRFFDIAPRETPLDGEWVRLVSSYEPNDRMRVEVADGQGVIAFRPTAALANFTEGRVLWRNVDWYVANRSGALEILGSDDNYYPARFEVVGDRLHIQVDQGGTGAEQTWNRGGAIPPG